MRPSMEDLDQDPGSSRKKTGVSPLDTQLPESKDEQGVATARGPLHPADLQAWRSQVLHYSFSMNLPSRGVSEPNPADTRAPGLHEP